ncbi:response regulator transcription factor [Nonomuraea sp. NPDC050310]|uniref:response regulator transcription factor n=1 Tax=Nonomuraea sp. NPDC050310 TaxID=3154935 RepID=UPI0033D54DD4
MSVALVVDDEPQMTMIVAFALETQGFTVHQAHDGATALNLLRTRQVDLVVLDVLMPSMDGLTLCRAIRARHEVPIMMLTALAGPDQVVAGLECGADDYVVKPFHPREVALRAQALVRRGGGGAKTIEAGPLTLDLVEHVAIVGGRRLELPFTEFKLLAHLAGRRGTPVSWQDLLRAVWGTTALRGGRDVVKSAIFRLRSRLAEAGQDAVAIKTVRGVGYVMPTDADGNAG